MYIVIIISQTNLLYLFSKVLHSDLSFAGRETGGVTFSVSNICFILQIL